MVTFSVLGSLEAQDAAGTPIALRGPKHRAVLARLLVAHGRVVPIGTLIDDLWEIAPPRATGAIRTFVGDLRRALEPDRPPRAASRILVTSGTGYSLTMAPDAVDATRFERAVAEARRLDASGALDLLQRALAEWRGPAYADFHAEQWAQAERARLTELRLNAVETRADALLRLERPADAIPDLDAHVTEHPWRESAWRLLALALYRAGRQKDALDVVRRARTRLADELGLDPSDELVRMESDILTHAPSLGSTSHPADAASRLWAQAAQSHAHGAVLGERARLRSTVDLLRSLAIAGGEGLEAAQQQRVSAIHAAEDLGDPHLTARVIGAYDVPAIWSRSDSPELAAQVVAAAQRTLDALPVAENDATRVRLLAIVAIESRGSSRDEPRTAALEAVRIARRLDNPALLAFALNGLFMQTFYRAGLAAEREEIGAELIDLAARHDLPAYELLGRLIRLQSCCARGDVAGADAQARAADELAGRYDSPLITVFTTWYRALRRALTGAAASDVAEAYRAASPLLDRSGMPGMQRGMLSLALLSVRVQHGRPLPEPGTLDLGPYAPWVEPLLRAEHGELDAARAALYALPDPPRDHLLEALWTLVARAADVVGDEATARRAGDALLPARGELAGAGTGILAFGPIPGH
ncbi:AfsR/SARP family transcriptional regulator [Paramicrobacterium agarici]|uniref:DNA-binding SARP family transcriptional activator n=1 Tax=Paramicrobacterium agarici TaxID=630514 RepID=A0A2A9DVF7_9MICO|nr:BTAD domain-containing putative transcriptional regulator [Microbacterium agarici]PFG29972.1 DNA-binding SARP family transcriptional activator [Microbacterium agarici]